MHHPDPGLLLTGAFNIHISQKGDSDCLCCPRKGAYENSLEELDMMIGGKYGQTIKPKKIPQEKKTLDGPKKWDEMTEQEVNAFKTKVCVNCIYLIRIAGKKEWASKTMCDYAGKENRLRPCSPLECVEKGIFIKKTGRKRV